MEKPKGPIEIETFVESKNWFGVEVKSPSKIPLVFPKKLILECATRHHECVITGLTERLLNRKCAIIRHYTSSLDNRYLSNWRRNSADFLGQRP